jgi:tetratricopeptide (TPR) repeat protein
MGFAMRPVRHLPTLVVGLASVAGQLTMPRQSCAWDSVPASAQAEPAEPGNAGYVTDYAVQPTGYYDSRPRQASAAQPQGGINPSNSNRKGAFFHGQKVIMPNLPFGRPSTYQASQNVRQSNAFATSRSGVARAQSPVASQAQFANRPTQRQIPNATPTTASFSHQAVRVADGRPPQPIPNASSVSPWPAAPAAAPATRRIAPTAVKPAAPLSASDRLVAAAHDLSTRAQSEQEFTQIIETCRRAQASQASPATSQYANSLIAWSLNRRGQLKAEAGQENEAMLDFNDAIGADTNCWRALHNRGVLLAQTGQFAKAFDDFSKTIQLNPKFAKAYSNRAALFMVADNLDAAANDYNHAIEYDPNLAVAHRGYGRVCQLMGTMDDAIAHYDRALQLSPTDAYAIACRADALTDVGRYTEAAAEYDRAIELDPKSKQTFSSSAWLLATCPDSRIRNPDLAIQRAQTALELSSNQEAMYFDTLAAAQACAGNFDAAMDSARKAVDLAPADERDAYKDRLLMYQQAKPYRIAPIESMTQQVSYEASNGTERLAR